MSRALLLSVLSFIVGCTCQPETMKADSEVSVAPDALDFGRVYAGHEKSLTVTVRNGGRAGTAVTLSVPAPFTLSKSELPLPAGVEEPLELRLLTSTEGALAAQLTVGQIMVPVTAEVVAVPSCQSAGACRPSTFDVVTETCTETPLADGATCQTSCLTTGTCSQGDCVGEAASCDDANACTLDVCGGAGCQHLEKTCTPPTDRCQAAFCDPVTGCGSEPVPDGVVCGADDCLATVVDVCIAGQCVARPRPDTGRCANTWVTTGVEPGPIAFDETRGEAVTIRSDTWALGTRAWQRKSPLRSPPVPGSAGWRMPALAYDSARQRVVLLFKSDDEATSQTWEWDGTTWVQRVTPVAPDHTGALAYDAARRRVVLFGGEVNNTQSGFSNQTWEWDGRQWSRRTPPQSPPETGGPALAYDPLRKRVVLFGGMQFAGSASFVSNQTWEYDGTTWTRVADGPGARSYVGLAFDPATAAIVLSPGYSVATGMVTPSTWVWNGTQWRDTGFSGPNNATLATDPRRGVIALDDQSGTWLLTDGGWSALVPRQAPSWVLSASYDAAREAVVCTTYGPQTWQWKDGAFADAGMHGLRESAVFYDDRQQVTVAVGRPESADAGTWAWSGSWVPTGPGVFEDGLRPTLPPLTWDSARGVAVSQLRYQTGEFVDGGWVFSGPLGLPVPVLGSLAFDAQRGVSVFVSRDGATYERGAGAWVAMHGADAGAVYERALAFDPRSNRVVTVDSTRMQAWNGVTWVTLSPGKLPPHDGRPLVFDGAAARLTYFPGAVPWVYLPPME